MKSSSRILLISNSTVHGRGYLDHVEEEIKTFLGGAKTVLFFPFALYDRDDYAAKAKTRFAAMDYSVESAHTTDNLQKAIEQTDAIFIGGGNTFRLLKALQDLELLKPIRLKVKSGAPYIGSSAGSNVAGPTIKTTKDMPIVQPCSFDALGLVPFQISPHILIRIHTRRTWVRLRRNAFCNSSRKMRRPWSAFAKERGYGSRTAP